jgi:hypothetical protein
MLHKVLYCRSYPLLVSGTNLVGHQVGLISRDKFGNEEKIQNNISLTYDRFVSTTPSDEAIAFEFKKKILLSHSY